MQLTFGSPCFKDYMDFESAKSRVDSLIREAYQLCLEAGICTACRAKWAEVGHVCGQCHEVRERWREKRGNNEGRRVTDKQTTTFVCRRGRSRGPECEYRSLTTTCRSKGVTNCKDCSKHLCKEHAFIAPDGGHVCRYHYNQRTQPCLK